METLLVDISAEVMDGISKFLFILENLGFKIYPLEKITSDELNKGRLFIIIVKAFEKYTFDEIKLILNSIRNGQRLLVLLDWNSSPFFDSMQKILENFGIYIGKPIVKGAKETDIIVTENLNRRHRILIGVDKLQLRKPRVLLVKRRRGGGTVDILIRSEKHHDPSEAILGCATQFGNGKVLVVSSWSIIANELIDTNIGNIVAGITSIYWLLNIKPPDNLIETIRDNL